MEILPINDVIYRPQEVKRLDYYQGIAMVLIFDGSSEHGCAQSKENR